MGEIPELASPSRERPKNVCQSVNTRREDAVRPSSFNQSMPLFTTSNCRPSVFCFFKIYFKINKYEHLALKNISFYEIDDFSFLSFCEKKKVPARVDKLHLGDSCVGFLYGEIINF